MTAHLVLAQLLLPVAGSALMVLLRRNPNLREAASAGDRRCAFCASCCASTAPGERRRPCPRSILVEPCPGMSIALEVEPLGVLFALDRVVPLDRDLRLRDRLHAWPPREEPDALLLLLRLRHRLGDGCRLRGQSLHTVRLLRGADADDLPAGDPRGHGGRAAGGTCVPGHPLLDLDRVPAARDHLGVRRGRHPGLRRRRHTAGTTSRRGRCRCCLRCSSSGSARLPSCPSTAGFRPPWWRRRR